MGAAVVSSILFGSVDHTVGRYVICLDKVKTVYRTDSSYESFVKYKKGVGGYDGGGGGGEVMVYLWGPRISWCTRCSRLLR